MNPARHFTLAEANALLPRVKELVGQVRAHARALRARAASSGAPGEDTPAWDAGERQVDPAYFARLQALSAAADLLRDEGVQVKDLDRGLVDFPAQHEGRTVLLCWMEGEETIGHFHELDAGYAGRRPVEELRPGIE